MEVVELGKEFMEEFHKEHPEFAELDMSGWCECEQESDPIYHTDNFSGLDVVIKTAGMEYCVDKHHYHCGWCLKLSQIG